MKLFVCVVTASTVLATVVTPEKRAWETKWLYEIVTVTVTADSHPNPSQMPPTNEPVQGPRPALESTASEPPDISDIEKAAASTDYKQTVLDQHNIHRRNHSSPDLQWSDRLALYAKATAEGCVFEHDMTQGSGGYGQNLASYSEAGRSGNTTYAAARAITEQWYNGEFMSFRNFFGLPQPPFSSFHAYGHLTQLIWKSSMSVGCHTANCPAGTVLDMEGAYTVCNYDPPGNFGNQYAINVHAPLGSKIAIL